MKEFTKALRGEMSNTCIKPSKGARELYLSLKLRFRSNTQRKISRTIKLKLMTRGDGLFQVLERINNNAYKLKLSGEYRISVTFNITNLGHLDVRLSKRLN